MDDEERKQDESLLSKIKGTAKKSNKSKFKMIATRLAGIFSAIVSFIHTFWLPILVITATIVLGAIIHEITEEGNNNVSQVAASTIIEENATVTANSNGEPYVKIDKGIIDKYIKGLNRAYEAGYYYDKHPENKGDNDYTYDEDDAYIKESEVASWFQTEDYEPYLIKMIRAQIAGTYPKLGDYEGEGLPDKARKFKR